MKRAICAVLVVIWWNAGCATSGKCNLSEDTIPLCAVVNDASEYDNKVIAVEGLYYWEIHGAMLRGADCPKKKVNVRLASEFKGSRSNVHTLNAQTRRHEPADVVMRGRFRVAGLGECFGQTCAPFELEVSELLCVQTKKEEVRP